MIGVNAPVEVQGDGARREGNAPRSTHERESVGSVGNLVKAPMSHVLIPYVG